MPERTRRPLHAVRRTAAQLPSAVRGRGERTRQVTELRLVLPELPRDPQRRDLEGSAEGLLRRAAAAEAAREGVDVLERLVDLPEGWTRADLVAAQIPRLPSWEAFVIAAADAPRIRPLQTSAPEALAALRSPSAHDAYGLTLEAAGDAASWVLTRAAELCGEPVDELLAPWSDRARRIVRDALTRAVTVPQELRVAIAHHEAVARAPEDPAWFLEEGAAPEGEESPTADEHERDHERDHQHDADADAESDADAPHGPSAADRARTVREFLRSDAGRATLEYMLAHRQEAGHLARELYRSARGRGGRTS